ncbi:fatty acid desaturase [Chitinophagaceae bacterium MMS25-I14]
MLEGKALILATKAFAKEDRRTSWLHLASTLIILCGLFAATFLIHNIALKAFFSILFALTLVRMFIIYHDYLHHTILNHSRVANAIMTVFGVLILAPKNIWKRSHDHHHKHNSKLFSASIGSYPIATKEKFISMTAGERRAYLAVRHPLTIACGYFTMFIFGMCISSFVNAPKKHTDSLVALIVHAALSVALFYFFGWQAWLFCIFIPFFISSAIGAYLFYAQHNFPGVTFYVNEDWAYEKAALESSSYMKMGPLMNWFTGNIGYHHIHHLNSRIPFYKLPEAMKGITELQHAKTTSLSVRDIRDCFRLKVWDPEAGQMVGIRSISINAPHKVAEVRVPGNS